MAMRLPLAFALWRLPLSLSFLGSLREQEKSPTVISD